MSLLRSRNILLAYCLLCLVLLFSACGDSGKPSVETSEALASGTWLMEGGSPSRSRVSEAEVGQPLQLTLKLNIGGDTQYASPISVGGGMAFVEGNKRLHALDLRGGTQRWDIPLLGSYLSPAIVDDVVYVRVESGSNGYLVALNGNDGTKVWEYKFAAVGSSNDDIGGHVTSPVIIDGLVIVGAAKTIEALDAKTGKPRWRTELKDAISSSVAVSGDLVYVTDLTTLYALDLHSGGEIWQQQFELIPPMFAPITAGDRVFVATKSGIHALDRQNGANLWSRTIGSQPLIPSAADGDRLFVKTINQLYALDVNSGDLLWQYEQLNYISIPAVTKEYLYVVTNAGSGSLLRVLQRENGKEVWSSENLDLNNGAPIIAGPVVYVRTTTGGILGFQSEE